MRQIKLTKLDQTKTKLHNRKPWFSVTVSRLLAHQRGRYTVYEPLLGGNSNNATFKSQNSMSYISIDFRPSAPAQLAVASSNNLKPVWSSLVHMANRNSVACQITSDLDFNKGGCVIQI